MNEMDGQIVKKCTTNNETNQSNVSTTDRTVQYNIFHPTTVQYELILSFFSRNAKRRNSRWIQTNREGVRVGYRQIMTGRVNALLEVC